MSVWVGLVLAMALFGVGEKRQVCVLAEFAIDINSRFSCGERGNLACLGNATTKFEGELKLTQDPHNRDEPWGVLQKYCWSGSLQQACTGSRRIDSTGCLFQHKFQIQNRGSVSGNRLFASIDYNAFVSILEVRVSTKNSRPSFRSDRRESRRGGTLGIELLWILRVSQLLHSLRLETHKFSPFYPRTLDIAISLFLAIPADHLVCIECDCQRATVVGVVAGIAFLAIVSGLVLFRSERASEEMELQQTRSAAAVAFGTQVRQGTSLMKSSVRPPIISTNVQRSATDTAA